MELPSDGPAPEVVPNKLSCISVGITRFDEQLTPVADFPDRVLQWLARWIVTSVLQLVQTDGHL